MVAVMDPVFEALGLEHAGRQNLVAQMNLASAGYLPNHFSSPTWAVCAQGDCLAANGQSSDTSQDASQRALPTLRNDAICPSVCAPPLLDSPLRSPFDMRLLQTPDVKAREEQEASPLVLPDVLPAESRRSGSSCGSLGESAAEDVRDVSWMAAVPSAAEPPTWPAAFWPLCDMNVASNFAAAYPRSAGENLPCLATDVSQSWPTSNSPAPSTPLPLQSCLQTHGATAHERIDKEGVVPCSLAPAFEWETPPPPPRWAFRAEAPSFVPKENDKSKLAIIDILQLTEGASKKCDCLDALSFMEARTLMLRLRPRDAPKRKLSALALRIAKIAFINGRAPTPPPPTDFPSEVESRVSRKSEHLSGKGSGSSDKKGGKAEARGHIRATAADARAQLTIPPTPIASDHYQRGRGRRDSGKKYY